MDQTSNIVTARDEENLAGFFGELWRARLLVAAVGLAVAILGCAAGLLLPKRFDASVIVEPVLGNTESGRLGEVGSMGDSVGGLAALAGLSLPGKTRNEEALAVLESEMLTRQFITENNLLPVLFPGKWNAATRTWRSGQRPPTMWQANRMFKSIRNVVEDRESGLVTMTIRWKNPVQAAAWANDLVRMTNDYLRGQAIELAEGSIKYLNQQAAQTTVVEVKTAIFTLLQDEIEKEMIARGSDQYALKIIDPAYVPSKPAFPRPLLMTALGGLLGVLLASTWVYFRSALRVAAEDQETRRRTAIAARQSTAA